MKITLILAFFLSYSPSWANKCAETYSPRKNKSISSSQLEQSIQSLEQTVTNPKEGFFGPQSILWKVSREKIGSLPSFSSVALQIARPEIAKAITNNNEGIANPLDRLKRTRTVINDLIFGDLKAAKTVSLKLHSFHKNIKGFVPGEGRFTGTDEELCLWVLSTIMSEPLLGSQTSIHNLTIKERIQLYEEVKNLFRLFGIHEATIPQTLSSFNEYFKTTINSLTVSDEARSIMKYLISKEGSLEILEYKFGKYLAPHIFKIIPSIASYFLNPQLAKDYGLPQKKSHFINSIIILNKKLKLNPNHLRYRESYLEALERLKN